MITNAPIPLPGYPQVRNLEIKPTAQGFTVAPRGPSADLWIEAIVWVIGFIGLGLCVLLGGDVLRVVGAIGLVSIGLRALVRVLSATLGASTRTLRVHLRVPRPCIAGAFQSIPFDELAQLAVARRGRLTGLLAMTPTRAERWLVDFDPANANEYRAVIAWLETLCQRRLQA
jgi:hypothetical protein